MTPEEVKKIRPGLYEVFWRESKGGGSSFAAVGIGRDGGRWIAPADWAFFVKAHEEVWPEVRRISLIKLQPYDI